MKQFLLFSIIFLFLFSCSYLPENEKVEMNYVQEETNDYILIGEQENAYDTCFIFVPGGLVDPHVYMCWMNSFIEQNPNYCILLLKVPSNLAIIDQNKVLRVMKKFPNIKTWVIGGHSLGGVVASAVVSINPTYFSGLILMASWPTESSSLADWNGLVLSIYASNDGLATVDEIEANKQFLPSGIDIDTSYIFNKKENTTYYFEIIGGNHSGFGCYGLQKGDNQADITQKEQQKQFNSVISKFIKSI